MPDFRGQRFLLECLMELASYIIAVDAGILIWAGGDANASGQSGQAGVGREDMCNGNGEED